MALIECLQSCPDASECFQTHPLKSALPSIISCEYPYSYRQIRRTFLSKELAVLEEPVISLPNAWVTLQSFFTIHFTSKDELKAPFQLLNSTRIFIITSIWQPKTKKSIKLIATVRLFKNELVVSSELCIGLSNARGKEMKRSLNLLEKGVKRTRA